MLDVAYRLRLRSLSVVLLLSAGLAGCFAGTNQRQPDGGTGSGSAGTGILTGVGAQTGSGGSSATGRGGSGPALPVPPGCGDGINNQNGAEACDDGNTLPGDGCNGACQVEPNWMCPMAGACARTFRCGDGVINAGEVCDDGNNANNDGCDSTCSVQDGRYTCMAGKPCILTSVCGNKRVELGETCDDGNAAAGDGCSTTCAVESGWVCTTPGSPCARAARCGDSVVQIALGENCDDGATADGDGCSADCKIKGAGCVCMPGKTCVCPEVRCGNGTIEGNEKCDDGNTAVGDGCAATCTIERGYVCPLVKAPCVPDCGDGILTGNEQCDPGITIQAMACSALCRWNPGWACTGSPPTECHATKCGDSKKEGGEGCDDGNTMPFDGCSATCVNEPVCASGSACTGKCGDGIVLTGEACDDGNNLSGDGCSVTCTNESGFTCTRPPLGDSIQVPAVFRDFLNAHQDFEPGATGLNAAVTGLAANTLNAQGKPTFAGTPGRGNIASAATFADWYNDVSSVNRTFPGTLTLWNNGSGAYVNRWGPNGEQWQVPSMQAWCSDADCAACGTPPAGSVCQQPCPGWTGNAAACFVRLTPIDGTPVFFPVDASTYTPATERATATIGPPYEPTGGYPPEMGMPTHNFGFTSEVRYWFAYDSARTFTLKFLGDDDVWVFINGRLAVDLGGIHTAVGCSSAAATCPIGQVIVNANMNFGMQNGGVYEVVVFQAERQKTSSSYQLTLSGFNAATSACGPTCGDRVVTAPEQCDNGTAMNLGGYNQCTSACKLGPFCGDMKVDPPNEACDNGTNDDAYGASTGCGPGCKLPARCGDTLVQAEYGETCDDGMNTGAYGGCTATCLRGPFCGDGKVQTPQEACDDGANDGTYNTCGNPMMPLPNCQLGPRCGDGVLQEDYGEQCEPAASNDPNCTIACKRPGVCGDGVKNGTEECDYGDTGNTGDYGGCSPQCLLAPHCNDGIKNGPEQCDDGINDNRYGGCSPQCKLAPHCGDGMVATPYEQCDDGANNGPPPAACATTCKANVG